MRPHGGHPSPGNRHGDICHEFLSRIKVTPAGGEPSGPIRTAEDALTRMLALIQAIDGLDDLTPDYLQSKMGFR